MSASRLARAACLAAFVAVSPSTRAEPGTLTVAAAADLEPALREIVSAFESENPSTKIQITYGASLRLYQAIVRGAPYDLFLSADSALVSGLVELNLNDGRAFPFAVGRLVLWITKDSHVDLRAGIRAVLSTEIRKIAIGRETVAPYGVAAVQALASAGIHDGVAGKLVRGDDVHQAALLAQDGEAQAAFLPLSMVMRPPLSQKGQYIVIAEREYGRLIEQTGVVLKSRKDAELARAFSAFLVGPRGRAVLTRHGFGLPRAP